MGRTERLQTGETMFASLTARQAALVAQATGNPEASRLDLSSLDGAQIKALLVAIGTHGRNQPEDRRIAQGAAGRIRKALTFRQLDMLEQHEADVMASLAPSASRAET
jgi:hypothetical protein